MHVAGGSQQVGVGRQQRHARALPAPQRGVGRQRSVRVVSDAVVRGSATLSTGGSECQTQLFM